ncbi:MAG: hypothetical protein DWQ31_08200 [Planctomycetota bacterium]|nr:MAG: hypothetical protein DWQ31_08200 [Planctomycetota bacterium]REK23534.1 MAG: hypothetical protein DWQ42_15350 [Planctomycetota bacterium]
MACVGEERVECPNRKCKKGTVRSYRYETRYKNTPAGRIAFQTKVPIRVPCKTCQRAGDIDCEHCEGGEF